MMGPAMETINHKEETPFAHYERLFRQMNPADAAKRLKGVCWDGEALQVTFLGRRYRISHPQCVMETPEGGNHQPRLTQTFLLRYLLEGRDLPWLGRWKTFREMPWGETYVKAFTGRALIRAAVAFGPRLDAFRTACEKMGATAVDHGDAGYQFSFIGDYQMQVLVWAGDEEFQSSAQILYSDNFAEGFPAEDRAVAADLLINAIRMNM